MTLATWFTALQIGDKIRKTVISLWNRWRGGGSPSTQTPETPAPAPAPAPIETREKTNFGIDWTHEGLGQDATVRIEAWPLRFDEARSCCIITHAGKAHHAKAIGGGTQKANPVMWAKFSARVSELSYPCVVEINNAHVGMIRWIGINPAVQTTYVVTV